MAPASCVFFGLFCDSTSGTTTSVSTTSSSIISSTTSTILSPSTSKVVAASSTSSAAPVSTLKTSNAGVYSNCYYNIDGVGEFNTRWVADWTTGATQDLTGIVSSAYTVGTPSTSSTTTSSKIKRDLGSLFSLFSNSLSFRIVPSSTKAVTSTVNSAVGSTVGTVGSVVSGVTTGATAAVAAVEASLSSSTQLYTQYNDILYGSVRAVILLSNATGFTSFRSDTMEIDLNWLNYHSTYDTTAVSDASTAWHEYRVDWLPGATNYYIDSKLMSSTTSETSPGLWLWNAWSDGNDDSVFQMRSIDAYFNRTSVATDLANGVAVCKEVNIATAAASSVVDTATSLVGTVAGAATGVVGGVVGGLVGGSSSTSSSSITPTPTPALTTLSTSTKAPSLSAQATVSFTTISSAWTGKTTSTTTQVNGLSATVIVLTPGVVAATTSSSSTSSSGGYVYMTTTTDSGTFTAVQTKTLLPTIGTTATVQIIYPTPVTTCSNTGIAYAGYTNSFAGGQATYGYPKFTPTVYKSAKPSQTGITNYIAEVNSGSTGANVAYYGRTTTTQNWVIDHVFYLFARQDGYYSFNIPYTDDLQMVWYGDKAVSGWTRDNADIVQFWSSQIAVQTPQTIAVYLTTGSYLPLRVMFANGGGAGELDFNIYGPDGSTILASNRGLGTGSSSIDIVQFPCDTTQGKKFPAWGAET
ncbi:MAG: hypothetical protein AUREO_013190 [Aureobasidium pullulans]|nr:MAG: hypothetical protein AUREO_013190 [Aureobasidium pullulans]